MKKNVTNVLWDMLSRFSICPRMPQLIDGKVIILTSGKELVGVTKDSIDSSFSSLTDSVFKQGSVLSDQFVSMKKVQTLVEIIDPHIKRLDHIGFCYTVLSQEDERKRIVQEVSKTRWHVYEMDSVDLAKWYFIGDKGKWQDPMIELLPTVLPKNLPDDVAYWMPHIHIDINTDLKAEEIIRLSKEVFGDSRKPIVYTDPKWGTHCVRIWLGVVSGVNIHLDLSTKVRNLQWVRENMLFEIRV